MAPLRRYGIALAILLLSAAGCFAGCKGAEPTSEPGAVSEGIGEAIGAQLPTQEGAGGQAVGGEEASGEEASGEEAGGDAAGPPPSTEGITGAEATSGGALLWVWPPPSGRAAVDPVYPAAPRDPRIAYFRFAGIPTEGSLVASLDPWTAHHVWHTGNVVIVVPDAPEPDVVYRVALTDGASGTLLGWTTLAAPAWPPLDDWGWPRAPSGSADALVALTESRHLQYTDGDDGVDTSPTISPLADGDTVVVSFGEVLLCANLPGEVREDAVRSAFTFDPPISVQTTPVPGGRTQVRGTWPGVPATAHVDYPAGLLRIDYGEVRLPDPARVIASGKAPKGFAKEMTLTIDAAKLPPEAGFAALAGDDGKFRVRVVRVKAASLGVLTPENLPGPGAASATGGDQSLYPYPDPRDQWSLRPGPHTLIFSFSKPMNRGSVERSLVATNGTIGSLTWTFEWLSDRRLKAVLCPAGGDESTANATSTALLAKPQAVDTDGLPLWSGDTLWIRRCEPVELARVPVSAAGNRTGASLQLPDPSQTVMEAGDLPTGATLVAVGETGGGYLALEPCRHLEGQATLSYVPWIRRPGAGERWEPVRASALACVDAEFIDSTRAFLLYRYGWQVIDVRRPGDTATLVRLDPYSEWSGACLSGNGQAVAVFKRDSMRYEDETPTWYDEQSDVGLAIYDLQGKEQASASGLTYTYLWRPSDYRIPAAWLPGDRSLVFVDRAPAKGNDGFSKESIHQLARVDLAGGTLGGKTVIPGTVGVLPDQAGVLTAFESRPLASGAAASSGGAAAPPRVLVAGLFEDGGASAAGVTRLRVIDLATGEDLLAAPCGEGGLPTEVTRCLASPDGRYLAVAGGGQTAVLDIGTLLSARSSTSGGGTPPPQTSVAGIVASVHIGEAVAWSADSLWLYVSRPGSWGTETESAS